VAREVRQRLFVALEVGEPARAVLANAVAPLRAEHPWLRWTEPDSWHVTLSFVGSVEEHRAADVDQAAAEAVAGRGPLPVRFDGRAGTFAGSVFFASIVEEPSLTDLAADLTGRLVKAGFVMDDRDFVAHCTLARVPRGSRLPSRLLGGYAWPAVTWTARRMVVFRSRLRIGGVAHEERSIHPFVGGPR
jgi:RNA 2',3'-cyclic 3'-phosphodiesterase